MLNVTNGNKYGDILQVKDFVWRVCNFESIMPCFYNFSSPDFQSGDETWHLNIRYVQISAEYYMQMCLVWNSSTVINQCTSTYCLQIKNAEGGNYWSSPQLTDTFSTTNPQGTRQTILEAILKSDASKAFPGGILSLQVVFICHAVAPGSNTTDVGIQTSSNLQPQKNCSYFSDDPYKLMQNLRDLLLNGQKSDVTLNVKGKEYKAHQTILMCRSPVFSRMFNSNMMEQNSGSVEITDCSPEVFDIFLLYLYTGQVENITVSNVVELYSVAHKYGVTELSMGCASFMMCNMCVESFCNFVTLALQHFDQQLLESAIMFFTQNFREIIASDKWKSYNAQNPTEANELLVKALDEVKLPVLIKK